MTKATANNSKVERITKRIWHTLLLREYIKKMETERDKILLLVRFLRLLQQRNKTSTLIEI